MIKNILVYVLIIVGFAVLIVGATFAGLQYKKFVDTQTTKIERDVREESEAYVKGMISDLSNHYYEYKEYKKDNDVEGMELVKGVVRTKFSDFDIKLIKDEDLKYFLNDVRGGY